MLFSGVPWWAQILFSVALALIVVVQAWTLWLYWRSFRNAPTVAGDESEFLWVFVVPALNEERTVADSVGRLTQMGATHSKVLVVDDGSEDATPKILATLTESHLELVVLRRDKPNAQQGKAAALNDAYRFVTDRVADRSWGEWDPQQVIFCVVDADGRLDPAAPHAVADRFADPTVAGVQVRVRIYNRDRFLTWCQDVEFSVYGLLFQAGRSSIGAAGMGGNGQFNRLSALATVDTGPGPWHHRLTEDQDIGIRFLLAGWRCAHDNRATVSQQGVPRVRPLLRQRTRWAQGNLQAFGLWTDVLGSPMRRRARLDAAAALWLPMVQAVVGLSFVASLYLAIFQGFAIVPGSLALIGVFYLLGFGSVIIGCAARYRGERFRWVKGIAVANVYAAYTWLIWPVLARATWRQIRSKSSWAKTAREVVDPPA